MRRLSKYRPIGRPGEPYPEWVRALMGKVGVYVIRDRASREVLYVGESHRRRLYRTLTRHFQAWSGETAGPTYPREDVEVAVKTVADRTVGEGRRAKPLATVEQDKLIRRLRPLDNRRKHPEHDPDLQVEHEGHETETGWSPF